MVGLVRDGEEEVDGERLRKKRQINKGEQIFVSQNMW